MAMPGIAGRGLAFCATMPATKSRLSKGIVTVAEALRNRSVSLNLYNPVGALLGCHMHAINDHGQRRVFGATHGSSQNYHIIENLQLWKKFKSLTCILLSQTDVSLLAEPPVFHFYDN